MEPRRTPPEYFLEIFADTTSVKDVLKGLDPFFLALHLGHEALKLHFCFFFCNFRLTLIPVRLYLGVLNLIFFHRYFPSIRPNTVDVLDLTLPVINDVELETLIDSRVSSLVRQHLSSSASAYGGGGVRGRIAVEFYEKRRKRAGLWFGGLAGKGEEEVCWEIWTLDVTIATPRTDSGMCFYLPLSSFGAVTRLQRWIRGAVYKNNLLIFAP